MDSLTPFEREAIETILRGDHPALEGLRTQLEHCEVSNREFSGVGFFTTLSVPSEVASVPLTRRLDLGDVQVSMEGVPDGVGIVLFVDEGRLDMLEGFTYDGPWPRHLGDYSITKGGVTHGGGSLTDTEEIEAAWVPGSIT